MSRYARRKDSSHAEVVQAFRMCGCSVEVHEPSTAGAPDLIVGVFGVNLLVEVKPSEGAKAATQLRDNQRDWHARWRGRAPVVVRTTDDVMALVAQVRGALHRSEVAS